MAKSKKDQLEETKRVMRMPPKQHDDMKLGKGPEKSGQTESK
jgi:hypothetical protein